MFPFFSIHRKQKEPHVKFHKLPPIFLALFCLGQAHAGVSLQGTGSTLAGPLFSQWIQTRLKDSSGIQMKYESKDSAEGVQKALAHASDFAVTDTPVTSSEQHRLKGRVLLCLPVGIEAVAITYNLPGVSTGLKLTPSVLSGIFRGSIKKWNADPVQELNPEIKLPDMEIRVVHRGDESSLHDLFPSYLAAQDPQWTLKHEKDNKIHWVVGQNVKGNDKAYEKLRIWPGVIAAVDLTFAAGKHLPMAALKNEAGHFVEPSVESLSAAGSGLSEDSPEDPSSSKSPKAYPLCSFSYLLVQQDYFGVTHNHPRGQALMDFLSWIFTDGQKAVSDLSYAPLAEGSLAQAQEKLKTLKY